MPSGRNTRSAMNSPRLWPDTTSSTRPSTSVPEEEEDELDELEEQEVDFLL